MPKLYDDEGNEVEGAKTAEEIAADTKAAADAARTEAQKSTADQIAKLEKDLADAKKASETSTEKTAEQKAAEEKAVADKQALVDAAKGAAIGVVFNTYKEQQIAKLSGGDKKVEEAIRANLKNISSPEETQEQIDTKLRQAYVVTSDQLGTKPDTGVLNRSFGGGGGSSRPASQTADTPSPEIVAIGLNLGVNQEDWAKFGAAGGNVANLKK